jgi:hypothetical protein
MLLWILLGLSILAPGVVPGPHPVTLGTLPNRAISGYNTSRDPSRLAR